MLNFVPLDNSFTDMDGIAEDVRSKLLKQFGSFALAYSVTFQPELRYFGDEQGFLAYRNVGKTAFVLADPIADSERHEALIDAFIAKHPDVVFCQISFRTAEILSHRSFWINEFGCESIVDLNTFSFDGPKQRSFRTAANRFAASGHVVREMSLGELDPAAVRAISDRWRRTKVTKHRELRFLVRPVVITDEPGVRKFLLLNRNGEPEGFAFFDPVYEEGRIIGYLSATRRWLPTSNPLAAYFMVRTAIEKFQAEGVAQLFLGLSPFHHIEDKEFEKNWLVRRTFRFMYTNYLTNRFFYPVQNLSKHKASYCGLERQTYYAFNTLPSLPRLLKLTWACRIV